MWNMLHWNIILVYAWEMQALQIDWHNAIEKHFATGTLTEDILDVQHLKGLIPW